MRVFIGVLLATAVTLGEAQKTQLTCGQCNGNQLTVTFSDITSALVLTPPIGTCNGQPVICKARINIGKFAYFCQHDLSAFPAPVGMAYQFGRLYFTSGDKVQLSGSDVNKPTVLLNKFVFEQHLHKFSCPTGGTQTAYDCGSYLTDHRILTFEYSMPTGYNYSKTDSSGLPPFALTVQASVVGTNAECSNPSTFCGGTVTLPEDGSSTTITTKNYPHTFCAALDSITCKFTINVAQNGYITLGHISSNDVGDKSNTLITFIDNQGKVVMNTCDSTLCPSTSPRMTSVKGSSAIVSVQVKRPVINQLNDDSNDGKYGAELTVFKSMALIPGTYDCVCPVGVGNAVFEIAEGEAPIVINSPNGPDGYPCNSMKCGYVVKTKDTRDRIIYELKTEDMSLDNNVITSLTAKNVGTPMYGQPAEFVCGGTCPSRNGTSLANTLIIEADTSTGIATKPLNGAKWSLTVSVQPYSATVKKSIVDLDISAYTESGRSYQYAEWSQLVSVSTNDDGFAYKPTFQISSSSLPNCQLDGVREQLNVYDGNDKSAKLLHSYKDCSPLMLNGTSEHLFITYKRIDANLTSYFQAHLSTNYKLINDDSWPWYYTLLIVGAVTVTFFVVVFLCFLGVCIYRKRKR